MSVDTRRRLAGAELGEEGETAMQGSTARSKALPLVAWEIAVGDPLLGLAYALDFLELKREGVESGSALPAA